MSIDETLGLKKDLGYATGLPSLKQKVSPFIHKHCIVVSGSSFSAWVWNDASSAEESATVLKSTYKDDGRWENVMTFQSSVAATGNFSSMQVTLGTMISVPGEDGGFYYAEESEDTPDDSDIFATAVSGVILRKVQLGSKSITGLLDSITESSYTLTPSAQLAGKIQSVIAEVDAGELSVAVTVNGVNVTGLESVSVTTSTSTTTLGTPYQYAAGDRIAITISGINSAQRLSFIVVIK